MVLKQVDLAHLFWKEHLREGDWVIDATCGNGHDALFLSSLRPGRLTCIDVQPAAIEATRKKVPDAHFHLGCHSTFPESSLSPHLRLIVYNLGYLPGSDKQVTTRLETTKASIEAALEAIPAGGAVSIMFYPGHNEGLNEMNTLMPMLENLDPKSFAVKTHGWLNRNRAPQLVFILKIN